MTVCWANQVHNIKDRRACLSCPDPHEILTIALKCPRRRSTRYTDENLLKVAYLTQKKSEIKLVVDPRPCGWKLWHTSFFGGVRYPKCVMHSLNLKHCETPHYRNTLGNFLPVGPAQQTTC